MRRNTFALAIAVVATVTLALAAPAGFAAPPQEAAAPAATPEGRLGQCTAVLSTTLSESSIGECGAVDVSMQVEPFCAQCEAGINVVIIQEETPWANWERQQSLEALRDVLNFARADDNVRIGVVHYSGTYVRTALPMTEQVARAQGPLNQIGFTHDPRGLFEEAAQEGLRLLRNGRRMAGGPSDKLCEFVIFFAYTKNYMADKGNEMIRAGRVFHREGVKLFVGCPHEHPEECHWAPQVPLSRQYYTESPEQGKLRRMVQDKLRDIEGEREVVLRTLDLEAMISPGLKLVPDSVVPEPEGVESDEAGFHLTWKRERMRSPLEPLTVTFRVEPEAPGDASIDAKVTLTDMENKKREESAASQRIEVLPEICGVLTPTPTAPPTATPTATATDLPTETPTPSLWTIYLPQAYREECVVDWSYADVALVIDISTSMNDTTSTGRTKLAAAQEAARSFLGLMDFTPDDKGLHDRVAIAGFNRERWVVSGLTNDQAALEQAIDHLPSLQQEGTRLDYAFTVGGEALSGVRHQSTAVMVVLTDGLPNLVPVAEDGTMETTVLRAVQVEKDAGAEIYTVGLGTDDQINPVLLTMCATDADHYFQTPDGEDLAGIYSAIAFSFGCGAGERDRR